MLTPEKIAAIREFEAIAKEGRHMAGVKSSLPSFRRYVAREQANARKLRELGVTQDDIREAASEALS